MSSERPDDDATDPVEGDARGPVEDAAEEAVAEPAEKDTEARDGRSPAESRDSGDSGDSGDSADSGEVRAAGPSGERDADDGPAVPRRRPTSVIVAVAAAVLLVGGGGAYVATSAAGGSGSPGTPAGDGTPPPLALDGYSETTTSTGPTGGPNGIAPGEPDPYGTTYRADGKLPEGPGSAPVHWAEGSVTRAEVERLAKALDLAGTPRLVGDAWTVGAVKDGSEPNLRVNADAPGTWTFSYAIPGTDNCPRGKPCRPGGSGGSGGLSGAGPGPVGEAAAKKAAAPVLKAVGQDDAKLDATQLMDRVRVVNADPVVGGLPTYGWTTGLRIDGEGHVIGGSGQLKTPVKGDTYPVVGARRTLDLMNGSSSGASPSGGGRMGIGGCASPVPLKDRDEQPCEHPTTGGTAQSVTVEKATFGLAAHRADGRQALVPSWLFEVRAPGAGDTYTVTHPAIDPEFLTAPEAPGQPTPAPTSPGDESSASPRDVHVQGYTTDGSELTVSFTGGVCATYTVAAKENGDRVTVTVTEKPEKGKVCILIAKIYQRTVRLDGPVDGRSVVGSDGRAIHQGRVTEPGASGTTGAGPR
ncbi:hypothetical protein OG458_29615 [Streptomyces sp. NBC_01281]|uniref:hypothetical protein n=1 Tax=Streptomyces sp. NBC_01281 TaxID=2903811 RepID=UPI002E14957E|nr:hypothetical protein OG458_29615 [Streptomyces sp. NBC_01281]